VLEKEGLPAIIVGVDTALTRVSELCPNMPVNPDMYTVLELPPEEEIIPTGNLYAEFITDQLKSFVDEKFMTLPDTANTAVGGASLGGLMSLYMLLKYPGIYGKAMVFAPYLLAHYTLDIFRKLELYDFTKLRESRIFIFNGGQTLDTGNWPYIRTLFETLRDKGMGDAHLALLYDSRQPHYESAWHRYFAEAFRYLFMKDNEMVKAPSTWYLQN